ncbi:MAG TPA: CHASE3 domain-containing protein [Thermoanaerobaculia bacterium]|jgi:two-component system CheB/CheR fusion protein
MVSHRGLGFRIAAGAALVALALVGLGWIHDANARRLLEANRSVAHSYRVLGATDDFLGLLLDAETGQRGYLLTGEESYLGPYTAAAGAVARSLDSLASVTADNPVQQRRVQALRGLADAKLGELAETVRLRRAGDTAGAMELVASDVGKRVMERIRETVDAIHSEEQALLTARIREAERSSRILRAATLGGAALVLALLVALILVIWRDLSGRARAEARLRTTLHSIGDAVLATDTDGRVTFVNPVCERLTGWSFDEAHGRDVEEVFQIVNESTRQRVENPIRRVLREGVIVGLANHTVLLSRAGQEFPIADSGAPIRDDRGRLSGVVLVFRDITVQRVGELAIRRLADIVVSAQVAIVGESLNGAITDWNPGSEALYGYRAEEMIGHRMHELAPRGFVEPGVTGEELAAGATREVDVRRVTKDGRTIDVAVHVSAIRDSSGRMIGVSRIQRDVTERRRQQEEIVRARRRAEEANATKDRFLANLSHELRTPLTPIVASVHRLQQRPDLPAGVPDSLAMIGRNAELEARLIDDLLDLTRITRGKLELHREPLDFHELVAAVVQSSRSELLQKGLAIETHLDAPEHYGSADGGRLQQVFWNLIRNAIKFTPAGGRVTVSSDNPEPGAFRVRIRDTGKGISPELLNQIFEPFVQGDSTAVRAGAGLGLGLSIAKTLVDQHGGAIAATSEGEGRGACFEVRLTTTAERPAPRPSRGVAEGAASGVRSPVSVLLVEDDADTAEAMRALLMDAGFDVSVADGVAAADAAFRRHRADVLVSDIGLPDGSGLEVLSRLRALRPNLPGIVLSGYGMEQDVAASRSNGFAEHFIKPVSLDRLIAAIDRLAGRAD